MNRDVIVACDFFSKKKLFDFLKHFKKERPFLKVGYQLYFTEGNKLIKKLKRKGYKIFLDLKLHDIPNTVANGIASLHASNGTIGLKKANVNKGKTKLLGITVLTSLDQKIISQELHIHTTVKELVCSFAETLDKSGVDGVVCSVGEAKSIKKMNPNLIVVCPGIRLSSHMNDQKRVATPQQAKQQGADYIVVGREIIESNDPYETYQEIKEAFI